MNNDCLFKIMDSSPEDLGCLTYLPDQKAHLLEYLQPLERPAARGGHLFPLKAAVIVRPRKSGFIRPFDGTASGLVCSRFYRLILSNGCPFSCQYCYLRLTLRRNNGPVVFTNPWLEVERQLDKISSGVFSTGELADSLAVTPPLLKPAIEYFSGQKEKNDYVLSSKNVMVVELRQA